MSKSGYQTCNQFEIEQNLISPTSCSSASGIVGPQSPLTPMEPPISQQDNHHDQHQNSHQRNSSSCFRIAFGIISIAVMVLATISIAKLHFNGLMMLKRDPESINEFNGNSMPLHGFNDASVIIDTECGSVIGDQDHDGFAFKGIPYALPPVGPLRWSPPIPIWNSTEHCYPNDHHHVHANKFGSPCFQVNPYTGQYEGQEDCLYLNVWTPVNDQMANHSVMVWIHGGFLQWGSGHHPGLRPSGKLSAQTNTVYVSLNYRLHAFGFMSLDLLQNQTTNTSSSDKVEAFNSPNYGLQDVLVALQWVQRNIKYFGGDPTKVTLFGTDGGAALILAIMTSPTNKNLFNSVWITDAAVYFNRTNQDAIRYNNKNFLKRTQCLDLQCLRLLSSRQIIEHFLGKNDPSFRINDQNDLPILGILSQQLVVVDGIFVFDAFPFKQQLINVPILIGSTSHAIEFWPGPSDLNQWNWSDYRKYVTTSLDSFGMEISKQALELYPAIEHDNFTSPSSQYIKMVTDLRQKCPIDHLAVTLSMSSLRSAKIFRYNFDGKPSEPIRIYDCFSQNSFHLIDLISYFNSFEQFIKFNDKNSNNNTELVHLIHSIVSLFIQHIDDQLDHDPNISNFTANSMPNHLININNNSFEFIEFNNFELNQQCKFWQNNSFFNYSWTA